ncbi:MAG TPA: GAF domain-containing sensor histidine kinase [Steroidobacteraceae bacterium]|nr:GAF domain-containing sensor histidine kinase [Steroidobacteraceae bacterium]
MNAANPMAPICASAAQSREQLLGATAQASRLLLESSDVMARMSEVLQLIGEAAGVDRTTLALAQVCDNGEHWLEIKAQWSAPGIAASEGRDAGAEWNPRRNDCFCTEFSAGRSVYLCDEDRPADSSIASISAKSSIIVPFLVDDEYGGAVGFDDFHAQRSFDPAVVSALEIAASVIGAALHRERLVDAVRRERELAAEQRVAELARANAALRNNLTRLASHPTEFFSNLLLETVRHAGAEAATAVASGYESDDWLVVCHSRDGRITEAEFSASIPVRDSSFMQQMLTLREPLHLRLDGSVALPDWPQLIDFHRNAGHGSLCLLPLVFGERNLGVVGLGFRQHEPLSLELSELLVALCQQVTLALALKRLFYSAKQAAVLAERNRMGREIHDGLAQAFTGILMQINAAEEQMEGSPLAGIINRVRDIAREGLTEARRSVLALRPDEQARPGGLELALRQLAERSTVPGRITSSFHGGGATGLLPEHEHALLRIAQEAVINAVRHAQPRNIEIHLNSEADALLLCIRDDGAGMHNAPALYAQQGFGLNNMRERAESFGGQWRIESEPGAGTSVSVRIPRATPRA